MSSKRILFLTFYYPPDLCAGSFRASALVEALLKNLPSDTHVDIITTQPNRYFSFHTDAPDKEGNDYFTLHRINVPSHSSGMLDQSRAFLEFARKANFLVRSHKYDLVIATSSRLMTAVLGGYFARRNNAALYLDIRDLFVENFTHLFPKTCGWLGRFLLRPVERWALGRAQKINLVSPGFGDYVRDLYPEIPISYFTNGIDNLFINTGFEHGSYKNGEAKAPLKILYAGNVGKGQSLDRIIPQLAIKFGNKAQFQIIGDGGALAQLKKSLMDAGVNTVELIPPMSRQDLLAYYAKADVLFLHLNNMKPLRRVIPSKLFEYAATGKPIWAGLAGVSADLITQEVDNAVVFTPCDAAAAVNSFELLQFVHSQRAPFIATYSRSRIMTLMAKDILTLLR